MKSELQQKLLKKYPEFFQDELPIYTGEKPMAQEVGELLNQKEMVLPIQFGFECGDGWYMLLDELMGEIQQYIKYHNEDLDRKFKYPWMWDFQRWLRWNCRKKGSWKEKLADWIYQNAPKEGFPHLSIRIDQIKEKFGGLRFYVSGSDKYVDDLISKAEDLSYQTCEFCGSNDDIMHSSGWIVTACKKCIESNDRLKGRSWKPHQ